MEDQAAKFREQKKHNSLLLVAASRGYLADVEGLLELGAVLDARDKQGRTPLHFAASSGRADVVNFLWSRGAEVDAESPDGRTPLHLAAMAGHAEVATFLLQKGAWAEAYDAEDNTPLHLAARHGRTGVLEVLVQHGAKAGAENKRGLTPLGCALVGGHVAAAKLLQGWGASATDRPHGYSLLHVAAGVGALASVEFLLEGGADPNECSNAEGATPLHSAALGGSVRCARALLEAGGDAGLPDAEGRLPVDLVEEQDERLRELLRVKPSAKAAAARRGAARPLSPPKSAQQLFAALPPAERLSKAERWSLLDAADLAAALRAYPPAAAAEATARLGQLAAARALLNIHKAQAALHADDDFQADAQQAHVREAIDAIRADTSRYERYAADPQVLSVLQKMRRLHGVAQANGQRTVDIESMLAQAGWEQRDAERQQAIEAACAAHLAAAAAAAATDPADGSPADAAQAAYDAAFQQAKQAAAGGGRGGAAPQAGVGARAAQPSAASTEAASILRQRVGGDARAAVEAAGRALEERERPADEDENVPEWLKGGFSWKKVGIEFWRQTQLAALFLLVFLALAWLVRGRPPWVP